MNRSVPIATTTSLGAVVVHGPESPDQPRSITAAHPVIRGTLLSSYRRLHADDSLDIWFQRLEGIRCAGFNQWVKEQNALFPLDSVTV